MDSHQTMAYTDELDDLHESMNKIDMENDNADKELIAILHDVCNVIRDAEDEGVQDFDALVLKARSILDAGVQLGYGDFHYDFMPSFAHDDDEASLVKDTLRMPLGQGQIDALHPLLQQFVLEWSGQHVPMEKMPFKAPDPWKPETQPHPKSTRLSRFRGDAAVTATDATPLAQVISQARCEITQEMICLPQTMSISPGMSCLAVATAGGWKNRDPFIYYYNLEDEDPHMHAKSLDPCMTDIPYTMALDEDRKLIFVADNMRIKSFSWERDVPSRGILPGKGLATHTMDSGDCTAGILMLPNGRIARAGKGQVAIWTIDELDTHGDDGSTVIGGTIDITETWRDEGSYIEPSRGNQRHVTVKFAEEGLNPRAWHLYKPRGTVLLGENGKPGSTALCVMIDLEHGGQTVASYLGHGGDPEDFSTSDGDPNVFATGGSDGFARLYDVRCPLPVLTFDVGRLDEMCNNIVLVHPNGVPTLFTSGVKSQAVKMWDIRARSMVYDLATGNNSVEALAWDERRATLYAATDCPNMNRMGFTSDYRRARIPRWAELRPENNQEAEDEDFDEDPRGRYWPKQAFHGESFFGYAFDAGDHRLFRYAFKADPDTTRLPVYGQAAYHMSF